MSTIAEAINKLTEEYGGKSANYGSIADSLSNLIAAKKHWAGSGKAIADLVEDYKDQAGPQEDEIEEGVLFIDYDGTVVDKWVASIVSEAKSLPANPKHKGLTAQGWNWTLPDIKAYFMNHPHAVLTVGQMYITDDGKTRVYLNVPEDAPTVPLMFQQSISGAVTISWGDGSDEETVDGTGLVTTEHTYDEAGKYVLTFEVTDDDCTLAFGGDGTETTGGIFGAGQDAYPYLITGVELGKNVTELGDHAIFGLANADHLILHKDVTSIGSFGIGYFGIGSNTFIIPTGMTSIPTRCCGMMLNHLKYLSIPNGVTTIGESAFDGCMDLRYLALPDSVTNVDSYAFSGCISLRSLTLSSHLATVGYSIVSGCNKIRSVEIPRTLAIINYGMFSNCNNLLSLNIPSNVTEIAQMAFTGCSSLKTLTFEEGVESIGESAFSGCSNLESLEFPESLSSLGKTAFSGCSSLKSLTIPSTLTTIGLAPFGVFYSLENLELPETMTTADFTNVRPTGSYFMRSLTVPEGVTAIESSISSGPAVAYLTLPSTLTEIKGYGLKVFRALRKVTINATTPPTIPVDAFSYSPLCTFYVPAESVDAYKAATNWSTFADRIEAIPT